jgi:hypothetical protein
MYARMKAMNSKLAIEIVSDENEEVAREHQPICGIKSPRVWRVESE